MAINEIMRATESEHGKNGNMEGKRLEKVDLSGLSLKSLPTPSVSLEMISYLDLSNNDLQTLPESLTAMLVNVVFLDLHSNQLTSLPNSVGCLSKLRVLNVSGNMIQNLPRTIEQCRSLEELNVNFNKLTMLPETIGFELTNLKKLSINSNKLVSLPLSTSHLTSLIVLDVRLNRLCCLPEGLENLIRLQVLNLSQNFHHLTTLPDSIGLLPSLRELDISYNKIKILPSSIGCLPNLQKVCVDGNPMISPPMEVFEIGLTAVKNYLCEKMNGTSTPKKRSWVKKLVKYGTFHGIISHTIKEDKDTLLMPEYRSIDGLATPRHIGMLSPRRLFSPRNYYK